MDLTQLRGVDELLTQLSVGYRNAQYVSEIVAPQVPTTKDAGRYLVGTRDAWRPTDDRRRPGTAAGEMRWGLSADTFYCDGHAQLAGIPDEWRRIAVAAGINLDVSGTQKLTDIVALNKEVALVAALVAGATTVNLTGEKWDDDDQDPVARVDLDKETILKACGQAPNTLLLSRPVFRGIRNNANVTGKITAAGSLQQALVTAQQLAAIFEVEQVLVADAVKLTSNEGATDVSDFVWGKYALLFYRNPTPAPDEVNLARTFRWPVPGGQQGRAVLRYRDNEKNHQDIIEVQDYYDQKVVVVGAGILYSNAVA